MKRVQLFFTALVALGLTTLVFADPTKTAETAKDPKTAKEATMAVVVRSDVKDEALALPAVLTKKQVSLITRLCKRLQQQGLMKNPVELEVLVKRLSAFVGTKFASTEYQQSIAEGKVSLEQVLDNHIDEFMAEFGIPSTSKEKFEQVLAWVFAEQTRSQTRKSGPSLIGQRFSLFMIIILLITTLICLVEPTSAYTFASYTSAPPGTDPYGHPSYFLNADSSGSSKPLYQHQPAPTPSYQPTPQPSYRPIMGMTDAGGQAHAIGNNWNRQEFSRPAEYPNIFPKH